MSCLHLACNKKLQCIVSIRMYLGQEGVACMAFWITDLGRHSQYKAGFLYISYSDHLIPIAFDLVKR